MGRTERKSIIARIEELRDSKLLCYVTGDRQPAGAQMGEDAMRPLYEQLRAFGHVPRLDLFLYSRGGAIDTPWRIINALRSVSDEWNVLIPLRANSAATLVALGADTILLGPQAELGPIDPIISISRQGGAGQELVNVEDVMAYVKFVQSRVGLSDQEALSTTLTQLTGRLDAVVLGNVYRTHSHIRDVARRVLLSRKQPANEQTLASIVETLAERVYAHGHAINLRDAKAIGLPAEAPDAALEGLMWELLCDYEQEMKLREPLDPVAVTRQVDRYSEAVTIAVVESLASLHSFSGELEVKANRQMPGNVNISLNLNLQLPQGALPTDPAALQQLLQVIQPQIIQQAQQAVQDALRQQAPSAGLDVGVRNGRWVRSD